MLDRIKAALPSLAPAEQRVGKLCLADPRAFAKAVTAFSMATLLASLRYFRKADTVLSITLTITSLVLSSASTLRWIKGTPSFTVPASLRLKSAKPS